MISLFHVLSLHHSFMLSIRSHRFSSSTPYISYLPLSSCRPSRLATSMAALFSPLHMFRKRRTRAVQQKRHTSEARAAPFCLGRTIVAQERPISPKRHGTRRRPPPGRSHPIPAHMLQTADGPRRGALANLASMLPGISGVA